MQPILCRCIVMLACPIIRDGYHYNCTNTSIAYPYAGMSSISCYHKAIKHAALLDIYGIFHLLVFHEVAGVTYFTQDYPMPCTLLLLSQQAEQPAVGHNNVTPYVSTWCQAALSLLRDACQLHYIELTLQNLCNTDSTIGQEAYRYLGTKLMSNCFQLIPVFYTHTYLQYNDIIVNFRSILF